MRLAASARTHTSYEGFIENFNNDIVYADRRVFARTGEVVDVGTPAAPKRAGKFAVSGALVQPVDAATPLLLSRNIAGYPKQALKLHVLDTATFTVKRTIPVEGFAAENDIRIAVQAEPTSVFFIVEGLFSDRPASTCLLKVPAAL